jgi:CRISPR-associated protein Csb2
LTEALWVGERVRRVLMGCSKKVAADANAAAVFSGKRADGARLDDGHRHAHYLCEANGGDARITHLTVFAPQGFESADEQALSNLCWAPGRGGYDLQFVLLGIGQPADFGGLNEKVGQAPLLAKAAAWVSRTPLVLTRHLKIKPQQLPDLVARQQATEEELRRSVRLELERREAFRSGADAVEIEPLLQTQQRGTYLGGQFTSWLKFRRERLAGDGRQAGSLGFGFVLRFPEPIRGPLALGYGCHFGLGQFVPWDRDAPGG